MMSLMETKVGIIHYLVSFFSNAVCEFPQARYLLGNQSQLPPCLKNDELRYMSLHFSHNVTQFMLHEQATGCKGPCINMQLSYKRLIYMQLKTLVNRSNIAIYYENTDTIVSEEMLLYDLNSIVSAVGGSLGLFLGFSCFQVALWMLGCVSKMCKKYQNKCRIFEESVI